MDIDPPVDDNNNNNEIEEIINEPEEDNNEENILNQDNDYNILPDTNFSSDMVHLTAYKQKVNVLYQNTDIEINKLITNDDKVVEFSWNLPFMNDISPSIPGYITKLLSETDTNSSSEEQQNINTKNSYYIEALNNPREYYLINKDTGFLSKLTSTIMDIIKDYIDENNLTVEVEEVTHYKFKNKHPDILFYNHKSYNIVIKCKNGVASNDAFLNHIKTKGKTILFTFVTCNVNDELYNSHIKSKFIRELGSTESKYYFFNINFLVTFLPLLKFLPRDILPFAIARANALKYTFENQQYLNGIVQSDDPTKQDKTLQHSIMNLFLIIKDDIYPYYLHESYRDHSDEINSRIFQIIEWCANESNARVTVISKNMEKQSKKPMYNYTGTGVNNEIIEEPVKKTSHLMNGECPMERKPITEDREQREEETYENLKDFYSNFDTELLDYYPNLYMLQQGRYQSDPSRKLPSLRQLSRLISSIFCLYLLLNDKGYASVSGGDLFRYLLYDQIKTSADLDYVFWLNNTDDKEEIIYKLINSLVTLIAFLQSALYFRDLEHFIEFDMFDSPNKSYKFIIEINGKGDHNKFTMRTMNNPVKFPVTLLSVDCNLKKRMYFLENENEYTEFETNVDKTKYPSSENYYVLAAIDMVIKDVSKMEPELRDINTEILRFSRDLMGIRYLENEEDEMFKTDDTDNYFTLTETIQTDSGIKKIDDIIASIRGNYLQEGDDAKLEYYNNIIQKLKIPSIFTNSNEIMEEDVDINESEESGQLTKKQRDKISNKTGYSVLLTPSVTPEAMLILVNEVLKSEFKLARIIGGKDKKDKKRKDCIEERQNCLIVQMYKDIEVIELDAVNNVKTGPIIRILRELIEMIVYKEPIMPSLESTIPEKYNIFIDDDGIVVSKLNELLQNINSQLFIDTDSDSSDIDYDGFENDASESGTQSTVYHWESPLGDQSQESIDIAENYPNYSVSENPVFSKKVSEALSKQTNPLLKKSAKRFASLNDLIGEITDRLYKLTTTNTKSGKISSKKILPNVPKDNQKPDIIIEGEKYIWVEVVDGRDHYRKEGDTVEPPTLYFNDGEDIYGPVPDLVEIVPEQNDNNYGGKRGLGGKRSPSGKRTRKIKRGKKNTRKTGNKKNKSKKRVSRVNKKRSGSKTRKNV